MKTTLAMTSLLIAICAGMHAQVVPAANGPGWPSISGNLHYSLRYSQTAEFGSNLGDWQTSTAAASVDYTNGKERLPFSLTYGGGYTWTLAGPSDTTGLFQHLLLSQGIVGRKWNLLFSDDVSYRPAAPTTGFSGVPGSGDPIGGSGPASPSSQTILTVNAHVVDNVANGEFRDSLDHATTFSAGGNSELLRYPDGNGLDTTTSTAHAGLSRRLDARNFLSGTYRYSRSSYPGSTFSLATQSGLFGFTHDWTAKISTDVSAGPQWTGSSDKATVPASLGVTANAALHYQFRAVTADFNYSRSVNGGAGYLYGAQLDSFGGGFSRTVGRNLTVGLEASYRRTAGLESNGVTHAEYGGAQASRRLGRYFSAFANYTAIDQSSSSALPATALSQLMHVVGFGVEYSPRATQLKR
jgi:hypothetical protein